ncbi:VOC family protein [Marinomonas balearica]|uniref:Catechol 2,3-dioxygenase-like lactoylglutathione lyase family enzyme n=1 Tax=Marinomonas balearica TaxID=491947 RepID=A0A4R6MAV8_9GAMM|nr:VOC family protein [Marinomonas balearica]TDO98691.1 catechol 2,3-dioxygenase-like lactoylglutathione lyase family enzyme [Marinomonas balearica]
MISRIDHIVLTVADIEQSVQFYVKVLGMEEVTFGNGRRAVKFGNQKINFQTIGQELRNHSLEGSGDLCLITNWKLEDVIAHLESNQVNLLEGPVEKSGANGMITSIYFNDLDNNLVEVSRYIDQEQSDL